MGLPIAPDAKGAGIGNRQIVAAGDGLGKPLIGDDETLGDGATLGEGNATGVGDGGNRPVEPGGAVAVPIAPEPVVGIGASCESPPPHATRTDAASAATPMI